jgi:hypothetical protein
MKLSFKLALHLHLQLISSKQNKSKLLIKLRPAAECKQAWGVERQKNGLHDFKIRKATTNLSAFYNS